MDDAIDLSSPAFLADPYPIYRQLREAGAPLWLPHVGLTGGMWLITRYDHVAAILKEARISKDVSRLVPVEEISPIDQAMLGKDPPDHTRLRGLASQAFTPTRIKDLEPRIAAIADELLDCIGPLGAMDFVTDFALPLPVIVIAELLGVPQISWGRTRFRHAAHEPSLTSMLVQRTGDVAPQASSPPTWIELAPRSGGINPRQSVL